MQRVGGSLLALLILAIAAGAQATPLPPNAVCIRCMVVEGTTEPEPVVAAYAYKDSVYYFCSLACYEEFKADPESFLQLAQSPPPEWATAIPS